MSESFESVMAFALKTTSTECMNEDMREWCYSADGCQDCTAKLLDRLKRAHDREIAEALCDACDQCDRVDKKAYEHEIEHLCKAAYHRGYEDGMRSKDADHAAVTMKLRGLSFDGGSHESLNKIAYAIYPCATGWTFESCEGLRDRIIDLLGGVHDGVPDYVPCRACGDDCHCGDGQQEAIDVDDTVSCVRADVPAADGVADSSFTQVTYDVLGNERHKAICRLRKVCTELEESVWTWIENVAIAIGAQNKQSDEYESLLPKITCRLIHLLGGDEPTAMEYIQRIVREYDIKCLDMEPSGAELSQASVDAMSRRAKSCKGVETIKSENECDGKIMESGKNHQIEATITDELRKEVKSLKRAAERDADQMESLNLSLEEMTAERDELQKRLDEMREQREHWADEATKMYRLCFPHDEYCVPESPSEMVADAVGTLREKYDGAKGAIRHLTGQWSEAVKKRKKLQAKLDAIREAMDE